MPRAKSNISPSRAASKPSTPVHETMDTLVQGISQQPGHLRLPGQGETQENGWSSPVEGLTKRNPAMLQLLFLAQELDNFYLEMFRLGEESYSFLIYPATDFDTSKELTMSVRNTNGTAVIPKVHGTGLSVDDSTGVVTIKNTSYLWAEPKNGTDPALFQRYSLINTATGDGSLLNRSKTTAMSSEKTAARQNNGIVFIQAVQYQVTYALTLTHDGTTTTVPAVTTPAATDDDNLISTSAVAKSLTDNNQRTEWMEGHPERLCD